MPAPTETALKARARTLLLAMTERERWVYAVPLGEGATSARAALEAQGLAVEEEDPGAHVARLVDAAGSARFVLFDSAPLDVTLIEASGAGAPAVLGALLERTGFYAQSRLLATALDVQDPECVKALRTLAHMVVAWDEDWTDLFLLHLASPDAVVRHEAVASLSVAAMVARDAAPPCTCCERRWRARSSPSSPRPWGGHQPGRGQRRRGGAARAGRGARPELSGSETRYCWPQGFPCPGPPCPGGP
ncbi:MAG: hypothetical protein WKG00_24915 [Polyangiaceae bacterium]